MHQRVRVSETRLVDKELFGYCEQSQLDKQGVKRKLGSDVLSQHGKSGLEHRRIEQPF